MILNLRHVGFVVRDLERSLTFYRDVLGLKLSGRSLEEGPYIDNVVGIPGVRLEWAKLHTGDGGLLELLQYHSHPDTPPQGHYPSNRHGCSHAAFTVKSLADMHRLLEKNGIHVNSEPQTSPDGKARVLYCHDPDGIILELVEEIKS